MNSVSPIFGEVKTVVTKTLGIEDCADRLIPLCMMIAHMKPMTHNTPMLTYQFIHEVQADR